MMDNSRLKVQIGGEGVWRSGEVNFGDVLSLARAFCTVVLWRDGVGRATKLD